jgi:hypothetical protein
MRNWKSEVAEGNGVGREGGEKGEEKKDTEKGKRWGREGGEKERIRRGNIQIDRRLKI